MDDLEFVQRCVNGDKQAWDEFLKQYSRLIYNYIYSTLRAKGCSLSQNEPEDIAQEILCALIKDNFKKLRIFKAKNGCSLASWIRLITINSTIDYMRRIKPAVSLDEKREEGPSLKEILWDNSVTVSVELGEKEKFRALEECIDKLDDDDKYFVELHINRNLGLEVLKEHYKVERGAIDMRKSRLMDRLKECFKGKGFKLDF